MTKVDKIESGAIPKSFLALVDQWMEVLKQHKAWPSVQSHQSALFADILVAERQQPNAFFADLEKILYYSWISTIENMLTAEEIGLCKKDFGYSNGRELHRSLQEKINDTTKLNLVLIAVNLTQEVAVWKDCLASYEEHVSTTVKEDLCLLPSNGTKRLKHCLEHPLPVERYFFCLCPVSQTAGHPNEDLRACSGCLAVCYSGKDAQKKDWKRHKVVCKTLQALVQRSPGVHPLSKEPEKQGSHLQNVLCAALRRELTQYESDLLIYPRLCNVCLDGTQARLKNCPDCHCVSYCSPEHSSEDKEEHGKSCNLLGIALRDYQDELAHNHVLAKCFQPRSTPHMFAQAGLPSTIEEVFRHTLKDVQLEKFPDQVYEKLLASEVRHLTFQYTCPLTILHAAEKAGQLANKATIHSSKSLVIHVVGARQAETSDITKWEIFHHLLPKLQSLSVVFIGPELSCPYPSEDFTCASHHLSRSRPTLAGGGPRFVFVQRTYHEFVNTAGPDLKKPDLVAALNCGFVFYKAWDASLPSLIKYPDVPLVFTEYYAEDCALDLQKLDSLVDDELDVVVKPSENPYCSALPARIPTGFAFRKFKRRNVVMSNDFICVVRSTRV